MKRNCNLELGLVTPSVFYHSSDHKYYHSMLDKESDESSNKKQQLTIFYNGIVASCDATELQARAIISVASGEVEEKYKNGTAGNYIPTTAGQSMKRSLQRFLEKRKARAHSISPYQITTTRHQL